MKERAGQEQISSSSSCRPSRHPISRSRCLITHQGRLPPLPRWAHAAPLRIGAVGRRSDGGGALALGARAPVVAEHRHRRLGARRRRRPAGPDAAGRRHHLAALPQLLLQQKSPSKMIIASFQARGGIMSGSNYVTIKV